MRVILFHINIILQMTTLSILIFLLTLY